MSVSGTIGELQELSRSFGGDAAERKRTLLSEIQEARSISPRSLRLLHDTLEFMRAYPDDRALRGVVLELIDSLRDRLEGADATPLDNNFIGFNGQVKSFLLMRTKAAGARNMRQDGAIQENLPREPGQPRH